MVNARKRKANSQFKVENEGKSAKIFDVNQITNDISMLRIFKEFIDSENMEVVEEFLSRHDLLEFFRYFDNYSEYGERDKSLIFEVLSDVLLLFVHSLSSKYSLKGQEFGHKFIDKYMKDFVYLINKMNNKIVIESFLEFVISLLLQNNDIALKVIEIKLFHQNGFLKLLQKTTKSNLRKLAMRCIFVLFSLNNAKIINNICCHKQLLNKMLESCKTDSFENICEILDNIHEKIVKSPFVNKKQKSETFSIYVLKHLMSLYFWVGDEKDKEVDNEKKIIVKDNLHKLMLDLCTDTKCGIISNDYLLGINKERLVNQKMLQLISNTVVKSDVAKGSKDELTFRILEACPDIILPFVEHLVGIIRNFTKKLWHVVVILIRKALLCFTRSKVNSILTEAVKFQSGSKFIEICSKFCIPSSNVLDIFEIFEKADKDTVLSKFKEASLSLSTNVLAWIKLTDVIESDAVRNKYLETLKSVFNNVEHPLFWKEDVEKLYELEFSDEFTFFKEVTETGDDNEDSENELNEDMANLIVVLNNNNAEESEKLDSFKQIVPFLPVMNYRILEAVEKYVLSKPVIKKKYLKKLLVCLIQYFDYAEALRVSDLDDGNKELVQKEKLRNSLLNLMVHFMETKRRKIIFSSLHYLKLLSIYGGSFSASDQKIWYIFQRMESQFDCETNYLIFGCYVGEYYLFDNCESSEPSLIQPMSAEKNINMLRKSMLLNTALQFPTDCKASVDKNTQDFCLNKANSEIYDPYFLVGWLRNNFFLPDTSGGLKLIETVDVAQIFSWNIVHFLIACQSSKILSVRVYSGDMLEKIVQSILDSCVNMEQSKLLLNHWKKTWSKFDILHHKVPSLYTNFYIKMFGMSIKQGEVYRKVRHLMGKYDGFPVSHFPIWKTLFNSYDTTAAAQLSWILSLVTNSVKDSSDFQMLRRSNIIFDLFLYMDMASKTNTIQILKLMRKCVSIPQVALILREKHVFTCHVYELVFDLKDPDYYEELGRIIKLYTDALKEMRIKPELEYLLTYTDLSHLNIELEKIDKI